MKYIKYVLFFILLILKSYQLYLSLFQVNPEKRIIRAVKCLSLGVNWFVFCPKSYLVLLSSGTVGNQIQALHVTPGNLHKLTKFES